MKSIKRLILLLTLFLWLPSNSLAEDKNGLNTSAINIAYLHDYVDQQQLLVDSQVIFLLSQEMKDALHHEIPLTFDIEFKLVEKTSLLGITYHRERKHIEYQSKIYFLGFNNQYFISNTRSTSLQVFNNLNDALETFGTIQSFNITNLAELHPSAIYNLEFRIAFNRWELPTPLIINSLIDTDWYLSSGWKSIEIQSPLTQIIAP